MKIFKDENQQTSSIWRIFQYITMRVVIGVGLLLKNIMLLPMRLMLLLVNKMGNLFRFSLTFKITSIYMLLVLVALIVFNISLVNGSKYFMIFSETSDFEKVRTKVIETFKPNSTYNNLQFEEFAESENLIINIYSEDGKSVFATRPNIRPVKFTKNQETPIIIIKIFDNRYLVMSTNIAFKEGNYQVQLMRDITSVYEYMNSLIIIGISLTIVVILSIVFVGYKISKNLLNPITTMTAQVKEISIKHLDRRLDVTEAKDELKDLAMQFNSMLDHIEDAYQKQNQFVSDASHELRTPISVINGYSSMLDRWGKRDPAILDESISAIKSETLQMQSLIEKLLFLARSDRNKIEMEIERVALHDIVDELYKETKMIDTQHGLVIDRVGESIVFGNNKLIKQMLRIFVENAMKFTDENGTITFMMRVIGGKTVVAIKDSGIGIPKEDLEKIFDRFYRSDKSRTKKSGGSGLGLSIAKWIIDQHGAEVKVYSEIGIGTKVEVWFNPKVKLVDDAEINSLDFHDY